MLRALAREHEFTVFSVRFENPDPDRIAWVRVPVPTRPLALLFVCFHLVAPLLYLWTKLKTGKRFDLVQSVESNLSFGRLVYAHFSHTTYLRDHQGKRTGLRGKLRWLDNWLHARVERFRYPGAALLVAPSHGLAEELERDFQVLPERVSVIANPVSLARMQRPPEFNRERIRGQAGFGRGDIVLVFAALGHFERKGLPFILEALHVCGLPQVKLLVVGGEPDLLAHTRQQPEAARLGDRVFFAGMQADVRPYLWSGDAFILPSAYETFSLVTYEAAAAGLPLLAPPLNGIRDLLRDGENGFLVTRNALSIAAALQRLAAMGGQRRRAMGSAARRAAEGFSEQRFVEAWRNLYSLWQEAPASAGLLLRAAGQAGPALAASRPPRELPRRSA